ncbi:MAG: hypothetical protein HeimC3_49380 [Candidatus Heimdallarchaeota archaeon LC_3]|nr:MAG: hypothetical protein HeimC3_49380 [Candidatus Heimdallarchaeota archaeon LC_3]
MYMSPPTLERIEKERIKVQQYYCYFLENQNNYMQFATLLRKFNI